MTHKGFIGRFLERLTSTDSDNSENNPVRSANPQPSTNNMGSSPKMVDIQSLIENYAWQHFVDYESVKRSRSEFKGLERDDVAFEMNMKQMQVVHNEPEYSNMHPTDAKPYTLFKTIFTNNTNRSQEYSFKTERSTESVCLICKEQGYTIGEEAEMTLKTPCEILEFKAGFKVRLDPKLSIFYRIFFIRAPHEALVFR